MTPSEKKKINIILSNLTKVEDELVSMLKENHLKYQTLDPDSSQADRLDTELDAISDTIETIGTAKNTLTLLLK